MGYNVTIPQYAGTQGIHQYSVDNGSTWSDFPDSTIDIITTQIKFKVGEKNNWYGALSSDLLGMNISAFPFSSGSKTISDNYILDKSINDLDPTTYLD